jgi:hypothetical protein
VLLAGGPIVVVRWSLVEATDPTGAPLPSRR